MIKRRFSIAALALAGVACISAPARAEISVGAGGFASGGGGQGSSGGAGILLSTGTAVPVIPVQVELTGFVPLATRGGYAVTAEGRISGGGNSFGGGLGVGEFGGGPTSGAFTLFFDHRVAPLTSIELRGYQTTGNDSTTAGFLGLRFSL